MKNIILFSVMMLSAVAFASCGGGNSAPQEAGKAVVVDLKVDEFKKNIADKPGIVLDVRTPEEIAEGKIPGAKEINIMDSDFQERISQLE